MAVKVSKITSTVKPSHIMVETGDGTEEKVAFRFKPNSFTPLLEKANRENRETGLAGDMLIGMLVHVLDWWDLEGDDGKNLPVSEDAMATVPINVLNDLMDKINQEMDPGKKKSDESEGSFAD